MRVSIDDKGLIVMPETDFEEDVLRKYQDEELKAFVKCGITPAEIEGLVVRKQDEKE